MKLLGSALCVCAVGCRARAPTSGAYLCAEGLDGAVHRIPCSTSEHRVGSGIHDYWLGQLVTSPAPEMQFGAYRGLSGAPVYTRDGVFFGVNAELLHESNTASFGILPASEVEELWSRGRALGSRVAEPQDVSLAHAELVPGSSVAAMLIWGDCNWGVSGKIAARRGNEVLLFGHPTTNDHLGACVFRLAKAPILAIITEGGQAGELTTDGPTVGTMLYNSTLGGYGLIGREPPRVALHIMIGRQGYDGHLQMKCCIARHPSLFDFGLKEAVRQSLMWYDVWPEDRVAELVIALGKTTEQRSMPISGKEELEECVFDLLRSMYASEPHDLDLVEISASIVLRGGE